MSDSEIMPFSTNLQFETLEESMAFFEDTIRAYVRAEISENNLRALTYAMKGYLGYWSLRKDCEIESRLDALEEAINTNE